MHLQQKLDQLKQALADMEAALAAPVLDGTPYVLTTVKDGVECWYGQPHNNRPKAFYSKYLYGFHQCGVITFGADSAEAAVDTCAKDGLEVRFVHWRELMTLDAIALPTTIKALENALLAMPSETANYERRKPWKKRR
jgi:hypothetical protein